MATLLLAAAGAALGGAAISGTILGLTGAAIGGAIGTAVGSIIDAAIVQSLTPGQRIEGARLDSLRVTSSTEGAVIPRLYGRMRMGGNVIWATDFVETSKTTRQGGKGGGGGVKTTTYTYSAGFAVALCEGPIAGIGRIWADGKAMDMTGVTMRVHLGTEDQDVDPLILAKMGEALTPAYRGTAYVVFEDLQLEAFGNRIPQITFEVFAPIVDEIGAEGMIQAVGLLPGTGEFALATAVITKTVSKATSSINCHSKADTADFVVALDNLENLLPDAGAVTLPVAWFGDDLRCGSMLIKPRVEAASLTTSLTWSVNGIARASAPVVSEADDLPAFGGTPADATVIQALAELSLRSKRVTVAPTLLLDIAEGNTLPNPYSASAGTNGQPAYPPRGLVTPSPALGFTGAADGTSAVTTQVAAFFGSAAASDFSTVGTTVTWTGGADWGYRRFILHYAKLCAAAGTVDSFLIGSGLAALTRARNNVGAYPAVTALATLAADVALILPGVEIGYAADWLEYQGRDRGGGTFDFNLDPLWSAAAIDFVGINFWAPLSDWRDGTSHLDAQDFASIYDPAYLKGNVAGGEYFDWRYASEADRDSQTRTVIEDAAHGKDWMFRPKDILGWWQNEHFNRTGGTEAGSPTGWVAEGKPIRFTEVGCPAVDRGTNQPGALQAHLSGSADLPHYSRGYRDDAVQRAFFAAVLGFFAETANNPDSSVYGDPMVDLTECAAWGWDVRPNPVFPELTGIWNDAADWETGVWLTGRIGSSGMPSLVAALCATVGLGADDISVEGLVGAAEGFTITSIESPRTSLGVLMRHFGFDATESGGIIRFVQRGRLPSVILTPDDMLASDDERGEPFERTRAQTTDLPQIMKWQVIRSDEDYDPAPVEARRATAASRRTTLESFPIAVPPEEAQRRVDRALLETWVGIEGITFGLPPSRLALDATDVVTIRDDGRDREYRLVTVSEGEGRALEGVAQDRFAYDRKPGPSRPATLPQPITFGTPNAIFLNLPQLADSTPAYQPYIIADADPWPSSLSVLKSPTTSGYVYLTGINRRGMIGELDADFPAGVTGAFDDASEALVTFPHGTLESVTDEVLLEGQQNVFAVETSAGVWEIFQAATATLEAPRQYRLSRLLRGQRGTEYAMGDPAPAGATVIVLDLAVTPLPIADAEVGLGREWIVGPSVKPVSDPSFGHQSFTPSGAGLRPFSPVIDHEPAETPRTPGDFLIEWRRRDRSLAADPWSDGEIPLSESPEAYQVEIYLASVLKRTLSVTAPEALYTAAMQTTDLGGLLDTGDTLDIRVYQMSARVGRGIPLIHTLQF